MSFFLPEGLRSFFTFEGQRMYARSDRGSIGNGQLILFDGFYASLLIGLTRAGIGKREDLETQRFIEGYPSEYSSAREFVAALIVDAELRRAGTENYEQSDFEREIAKLLRVDAPTGLSAAGLELANLYAAGGFAFLEDRMQPRPANTPNFFLRFHDLCAEEVSQE